MSDGTEPPDGTDGDGRNVGVVENPFRHLIQEPEEDAAERQRVENEATAEAARREHTAAVESQRIVDEEAAHNAELAEAARREHAAAVESQRIVDEETARNAELARNEETTRLARYLADDERRYAATAGVRWAPEVEDMYSTSAASETKSETSRETFQFDHEVEQLRREEMEEEIKRRTKEDVDRIMATLQQQGFAKQPEHDSFRLPSHNQSPVLREPLGVTGHSTQSGLTISSSVRSVKEQTQATIYPKEFRGDSDEARLKRKKMVTEKLDVALGVNSAISMLTNEDVANHDLATDCQSSQVALRALTQRCVQHDMIAPFTVALSFDEDNPVSANVGPYLNILTDYEEITLDMAKGWQRFVNKYAHAIEHESLQWAMELMEKSTTTELKELVHDDYEQAVDKLSRGTITFFKVMTDRMVLSNQETIDALCNYLAAFDIRNINGQNVVVAARKIKAII